MGKSRGLRRSFFFPFFFPVPSFHCAVSRARARARAVIIVIASIAVTIHDRDMIDAESEEDEEIVLKFSRGTERVLTDTSVNSISLIRDLTRRTRRSHYQRGKRRIHLSLLAPLFFLSL